ncbi:MAG TPA: hypothetical protein GX701_02805 [Clostridiales bacterium]|jgi:hypothetical protein|nr:hypothetical protein [Clostridiales bacterium]
MTPDRNVIMSMKNEILKDIAKCENYSESTGSEEYFYQLISKYSVLDPEFKKNLSFTGKVTVPGIEFDYRSELKSVAAKLRMWLLLDDDNYSQVEKLGKQTEPVIFISHRSFKPM